MTKKFLIGILGALWVLWGFGGMTACSSPKDAFSAGDATGTDSNAGLTHDTNSDALSGDTQTNGNPGDSASTAIPSSDSDDTDTLEICEAHDIDITVAPGRMMLLLDMSSSMLEGTPQKLDQAVTAVTNVLTSFAGKGIEFGLDLFPDGSDDPGGTTRCGVNNPVVVDCGMNNETTIIDELNKTHLTGATPLYCAMNNFNRDDYAPKYTSVRGNNILVVVTDGEDNCFKDCQENTQFSSDKAFGELASDLCVDRGIKTVAVGFAFEDGTDVGQLNAIAKNGCTEFTEYIRADDQADLQDALNLLAGLVISCNFTIGKLGERVDPDLVNVYFDDEVVPFDPDCSAGVGWTWSGNGYNEITFCEEACDRLNAGGIGDVSAKFGCEVIPVV